MDLALNNLQRLICHKTQTTNQPTSLPSFLWSSSPINSFFFYRLFIYLSFFNEKCFLVSLSILLALLEDSNCWK